MFRTPEKFSSGETEEQPENASEEEAEEKFEEEIDKTREEEKEPKIEVIRSKLDEFRTRKNFDIAIHLLERFSDPEFEKFVIEDALGEKTPDELDQYLGENKNQLSNEAKSYIHAKIEYIKTREQSPDSSDNEIFSISGREVKEFKKWNKFDKLQNIKVETLSSYYNSLKGDKPKEDPKMEEIIEMSMFGHKNIEEYIKENKNNLSLEEINLLEIAREERKARNNYFELISEKI